MSVFSLAWTCKASCQHSEKQIYPDHVTTSMSICSPMVVYILVCVCVLQFPDTVYWCARGKKANHSPLTSLDLAPYQYGSTPQNFSCLVVTLHMHAIPTTEVFYWWGMEFVAEKKWWSQTVAHLLFFAVTEINSFEHSSVRVILKAARTTDAGHSVAEVPNKNMFTKLRDSFVTCVFEFVFGFSNW